MTPSVFLLSLSLLCQLSVSSRLFSLSPLLNACAVADGRRGRREPKESSSREPILVEFDEYGNIPAIKHVYAAIDKAARTVVALSTDRSRLVCGYRHSENDDIRKYSNLRIANSNIKIVNKITYNGVCNKIIVITGFESDCRFIIKHIKRAFADYVSNFNEPPTALYLANDCASLLQRTVSAERALSQRISSLQSAYSSIAPIPTSAVGTIIVIVLLEAEMTCSASSPITLFTKSQRWVRYRR